MVEMAIVDTLMGIQTAQNQTLIKQLNTEDQYKSPWISTYKKAVQR